MKFIDFFLSLSSGFDVTPLKSFCEFSVIQTTMELLDIFLS